MKALAISLILILNLAVSCFAQTTADEKEKTAAIHKSIELLSQDRPQEALDILGEVRKKYPDDFEIRYETAVIYYSLERYADVVKELDSLLSHPECNDRVYQLLGNSFGFLGKVQKAKAIYLTGIKKFPNSARLHMERGIMEMQGGNDELAMKHWAKGTRVDPNFDLLHYRIAKYYHKKKRYTLALISTEVFLNLTRNEKKFKEMSAFLYNSYLERFCAADTCNEKFNFAENKPEVLYFELAFEEILNIAVDSCGISGKPDIDDLVKIRGEFIKLWFELQAAERYPNEMLGYSKFLSDNNYFDVYSYWVLGHGDEEKCAAWMQSNTPKVIEYSKFREENMFYFPVYDSEEE